MKTERVYQEKGEIVPPEKSEQGRLTPLLPSLQKTTEVRAREETRERRKPPRKKKRADLPRRGKT